MEGTIGEIRGFAGNFSPRSWAFCAGQLLAISSNSALFSIIGTLYGGDGRTSFALPDLRGRTIIGAGHGLGLSSRLIGQRTGWYLNQLTLNNLPAHTHTTTSTASGSGTLSGQIKVPVSTESNSANLVESPKDAFLASTEAYTPTSTAGSYLGATQNNLSVNLSSFHVDIQIASNGQNYQYDSRQPYLATNYIICLTGVFPSRS